MTLKSWVNAHSILSFAVLTVAITSTAWGLLLWLFGRQPIDELIGEPLAIILIYLGAGGPSLAAVVLTAYTSGRSGLRSLGRRLVRVKFPVFAWLLALGLPVAMACLVVGLYRLTGNELGPAVLPAWYLVIPPSALAAFFAGPLCEELGWRGYLQPRLLSVYSPFVTALLVGTLWCFWHIPLSFTPGTTPELNSLGSWLVYWVDTIFLAAIMLAIVVGARGSVLAAMLFHWVSNITFDQIVKPVFPEAPEAAWDQIGNLYLGVLGVCALVAIVMVSRNGQALMRRAMATGTL